MEYRVGTKLRIGNLEGLVIGKIMYKNTQDFNKTWTEYRLRTSYGERWLSVDRNYNEYSISWAANYVRGQIGPEWHEVDRGHQVVAYCEGDVDVERGDAADFVEFEDASEDNILSVEIWDDGTEYSKGEYIDPDDIVIMGYENLRPQMSGESKNTLLIVAFVLAIAVIMNIIALIPEPTKKIISYITSDGNYKYSTSITGAENQKATVYEYRFDGATTDAVAKDIIYGIEGQTESVTQHDDVEDSEIAIVTKKEYCLIYHPEYDKTKTYIQVSDRKYNYTSSNSPYRSSHATTSWYRSHYYSSGYAKDSSTFSKMPSAYSSYSGETIHNIGNGYFDSYSSSVRQSSINSRRSSGGGLGGGK